LAVPEVHELFNYGYPSQSRSMKETYSPDCVNVSDALLNRFEKVGIIKIHKKTGMSVKTKVLIIM
jgi:hypothetical protein